VAEWPNELPGLDIKTALSQLGGKKKLYLRLLGMFEDSHVQDIDRLLAAASEQDWEAVYEINHALKGVTGNLAASELYQLSIDIDVKLKDKQHDIEALLAALPLAMDTLLASISQARLLPLDE
jgi:HPt (histidine-containing phosphotransfer) domain-containing protein